MTQLQAANKIAEWAREWSTAPYGVHQGTGESAKGKKYLSVTFGKARTLDATVEVYSGTFFVVKRSSHPRNNVATYSVDEVVTLLTHEYGGPKLVDVARQQVAEE